MPISIKLKGSYANLFSFLQRLFELDRLILVETASFATEGAANPEAAGQQLSLNISGNIYYLADLKQLVKALPELEKGK